MTDSDSPYVDEALEALAARLRILERQAGTYGLDTPPHIVLEIEDIKEKLQETTMANKSIISIGLLQRMEPNERWKRLYDAIWEVEIILYTLQKNVAVDRIRLQARHTEFNTAIQRVMIENEYMKRNLKRMYYSFAFVIILLTVVLVLIWRTT